MRLALLGVDDEALELIRWAVEEGGHALVAAYDVAGRAAHVQAIAPGVQIGQPWESLLLGTDADAVVVGRGGAGLTAATGIPDVERRADQFRKLAQAAIPMVVVCPACESIVGFEIEMIRNDTSGVIIPYVPDGKHAATYALEDMVSWDETGPLGKVEQTTFEREQADRSREAVLVQLARDTTLLRRLIGTIRSVTASGAAMALGRDPLGPKLKEPPPLANLNVHLVGEEGLAARWSVAPAALQPSGRLTLIGTRGRAVLQMPAGGNWSLTVSSDSTTTETFEANKTPERIFWQLSHAASAKEFYDSSAWLDACRDQEVAEAADRSLLRGRTIELFSEQHTEESSFKGVMAVGGCLVLTVALVAVLMATLIDGLQLPVRNWPAWRLWPFYLLAPIAFFLALQLFQLALKRESRAARQLTSGEQAIE
jgi:hypothetical protein